MSSFLTEEGLNNVRMESPLECSYSFMDGVSNPDDDRISWFEFQDEIRCCRKCTANLDRTSCPILPEGSTNSRFSFVLRNPLSIDSPFIGYMRADSNYGQVFQTYLKVLGIQRSELYITGTMFCSSPDTRVPNKKEQRICGDSYKRTEIGFLKHLRILFLMGDNALRQFVDYDLSLLEGWMNTYYIQSDPKIFLLPVFHVGFYLKNESERMDILRHLALLRYRFVDPIRKGLL